MYNYEDENLSFSRLITVSPSGKDYLPHSHDKYELYCFVSGNARCIIESNEYVLTPDSVVLVRPNESHSIEIDSPETYERFAILFSAKLFESVDPYGILLTPFNNRPLGRKNMYPFYMFNKILPTDLMKNIIEKEENSDIIRIKIISGLFMILSEILEIFIDSDKIKAEFSQSKKVIDYINHNLSQDLSLKTLSKKFFISESQLNRVIKRATNKSIAEYINTKRLCCAQSLLQEGEPASTVYLSAGFHDYSTFYRAYKKMFGINPQRDMKKYDYN